MSFIKELKQAGIIRVTLALVFLIILFIALYDLFHPNSRPTIATGIVVLLSGIVAFFALRCRHLPYPQSIKHAIIILFSIGFILRTAVVVFIPNRQVSDFQIFNEMAIALSKGNGFAYDGPTGLSEDVALYRHLYGATGPLPTAFRMPGTPLLMAAVYALFGPHPVYAKLLNAVLGAFIGVCLLLMLWPTDPRKGFIAGFLWEIYPSTLFNTNLLGTEIHFTFGILLAALLLTKMVVGNNYSLIYSLAAGLVMGFTCLIRPSTQLILCMGAVSIWYVWQQIRKIDRAFWKETARLTGLLVLGIALPLSCWGLRNYRTFGIFEWQSTEIGFNFLSMTQNILTPQEERSFDSLMTAFYRSQDEFEIARLAKEIGIRRLYRAAPKPVFVKTLIKNFMKTWKHDRDGLSWCLESPQLDKNPKSPEKPLHPLMYLLLQKLIETGYVTILILAFFGAIGISKRELINPGIMMMLLYFFGTCILLCIFQGQPRYHVPFLPFLCIGAACSLGLLRMHHNEYH